jgi:hypothetical protein
MRVWWTICLGWPWTKILPILASQIARITVVSHQCPTWHILVCITDDLCQSLGR